MSWIKRRVWILVVFATCICQSGASSVKSAAWVESLVGPQEPATAFISAEDLKAKIGRNESLTIIDVRTTGAYSHSDSMIKGALFVKLRRLNSRLSFPPLKSVPRDSEVITYCACPNDEASIHAAQILSAAGFNRVRVLKGGWRMWQKVNGQVTSKPKSA
jgi:rhodanese-related sulfurtransferase